MVLFDGTVGSKLDSVVLRYGRGVGLLARNTVNASFTNSEVACVGIMAINVTGGTGAELRNLSLFDLGNGGVYLYAGDRIALTPALHTLSDATITRYNRYTHCYTPGVVLGGVGCSVVNTEIFEAPHQGIFLSGNDHTIYNCSIHDVTKIVKDSGAFYMGRDLTYRGNAIVNTKFFNLNSVFPGTPAMYMDDCASSVFVSGCTFWNSSGPFAASEGGKGHAFINNFIRNGSHGVHAVAKGCTGALQYLDLVPFNTSKAWLTAYPDLAAEVAQGTDDPWHLTFVNNTICFPSKNTTAFMDMSVAEIVKYNGTASGNKEACLYQEWW